MSFFYGSRLEAIAKNYNFYKNFKIGGRRFGITLQQIEIFLTVVHCQSISDASRQLFLSQPAVSKYIKKLEDTLGTKLFIRNHKGIVLTPEGLRLYAELDPVYQRFRISLEKVIRSNMIDNKNILNIGCFHDPATMEIMRNTTTLFKEQYPETSVHCELYNFQELREKLICDEIDIIYTFSFEVSDHAKLSYKKLRDLELCFLVPSSWNIPAACYDFGFLQEKTLLLEVNNGADIFLSICQAHGFRPKKVKFVSSLLLIFYMVAEGKGFTISGPNYPVNDYYNKNIDTILISDEVYKQKISVVASWKKKENNPLVKQYVSLFDNLNNFTIAPAKLQKFVKSNWYV